MLRPAPGVGARRLAASGLVESAQTRLRAQMRERERTDLFTRLPGAHQRASSPAGQCIAARPNEVP
jgi:hypothetical protein